MFHHCSAGVLHCKSAWAGTLDNLDNLSLEGFDDRKTFHNAQMLLFEHYPLLLFDILCENFLLQEPNFQEDFPISNKKARTNRTSSNLI